MFEAETVMSNAKLVSVYIGNIKKTVDESVIINFFTNQGVLPRFVKILPTYNERSGNGAKLRVSASDYDKLFDVDLPEGIYIRDWYERSNY